MMTNRELAEYWIREAGSPGMSVGDPDKVMAREAVRANKIALAQVHADLATLDLYESLRASVPTDAQTGEDPTPPLVDR